MSDANVKTHRSPDLDYQLQPLADLEIVGACRRGRRRGRRNRTAAERQLEVEQRRHNKNARERQRVENVKKEYAKLQRLLGLSSAPLDDKSEEKRRHCKLRTLTVAIQRIRSLIAEQNQLRASAVSPPNGVSTSYDSCLQLPAVGYVDILRRNNLVVNPSNQDPNHL